MNAHCILTASSLSPHVRKGREGKGREGKFQDHPLDLKVVGALAGADLAAGLDSPPEAWMEAHSLEDWDPPCEYVLHTTVDPASLVVIGAPIKPCGHPRRTVRFFCAWCWNVRNSRGLVHCECGATFSPLDGILRVEPIP